MLTNVKPIDALSKLAEKKGEKDATKKVTANSLEDAEAHGWKVYKTYKSGSVQVKRSKPYGLAITDRV